MADNTAPMITDFSSAMRCMDELLAGYGVRDISILVEDLADPERRAGGGSRHELVNVLSALAQRSGVIRLVATDDEWANTKHHLAANDTHQPSTPVPQYALRGNVFANDLQATLGLDLILLATDTMTLVPGTGMRNIVQIQSGGTAQIARLGVIHTLVAQSPAALLRPLLQLSAIELIGKLTRVPYWRCLGASDAHAEISAELQDWYDEMAKHPVELIAYFQRQLRERHYYDGLPDGSINEPFKTAVADYRTALGLSREPVLDLPFFRAYLGSDRAQKEPPKQPVTPAMPSSPAPPGGTPANTSLARVSAPNVEVVSTEGFAPTAADAPASEVVASVKSVPTTDPIRPGPGSGQQAAEPLTLVLTAANDDHLYASNEPVQFRAATNRNAHVYCFLQDAEGAILRFFPNRFQTDSRVTVQGRPLPDAQRFEIRMNEQRITETIRCYATDSDILTVLPEALHKADLTALQASDLRQVDAAFGVATGVGTVSRATLLMKPR